VYINTSLYVMAIYAYCVVEKFLNLYLDYVVNTFLLTKRAMETATCGNLSRTNIVALIYKPTNKNNST